MIYLDNAATSCPKPLEVVEAVTQSLTNICANPSRGAYELSIQASRGVWRARRAVADLLNVRDESRVVFTPNATHALNLAIKGLLAPGGVLAGARREARARDGSRTHVVTSSIEHNSVARPLESLASAGIVSITTVPCSSDGVTDPEDILRAVRPQTGLVVLTHASNVLGTVLPIAQVGPRLRARGVPLLVDAAQTAGIFPVDVEAMGITMLAVPGHKGLLGPQGVGILYLAQDIELGTLVEGGTGSVSESLEQPAMCPDRFESGTLNSPGIAGLGAAIGVVNHLGIERRGVAERRLAHSLRSRLRAIPGVRVFGPLSTGSSELVAPIVSFSVEGLPSAQTARVLDGEFSIAARAGLHCAPEAHRIAGTLETGLVRLSIGHTTKQSEVDEAVEAVIQIAERPASYWVTDWEKQHAR